MSDLSCHLFKRFKCSFRGPNWWRCHENCWPPTSIQDSSKIFLVYLVKTCQVLTGNCLLEMLWNQGQCC